MVVFVIEDDLHRFGCQVIHRAAGKLLAFAEEARATPFRETDGGIQQRVFLFDIGPADVAEFFLFVELNCVFR